jgi:hypothetical protein
MRRLEDSCQWGQNPPRVVGPVEGEEEWLMYVEQLVERKLVGETEILGENRPQCHFVQQKSHMTWPGMVTGRSGGWSTVISFPTDVRTCGKRTKIFWYLNKTTKRVGVAVKLNTVFPRYTRGDAFQDLPRIIGAPSLVTSLSEKHFSLSKCTPNSQCSVFNRSSVAHFFHTFLRDIFLLVNANKI